MHEETPALVTPTVSAWQQPPVSAIAPEPGRDEASLPSPHPLWNWAGYTILCLVFCGFAGLVSWRLIVMEQRDLGETQALNTRLLAMERRIEVFEEEQKTKLLKVELLQETMSDEQKRRGSIVLRVPVIADTLQNLQDKVNERGYILKSAEDRSKANEAEIAKARQELIALRQDFATLNKDVRDLTYVRQPKIPVDQPRRPPEEKTP